VKATPVIIRMNIPPTSTARFSSRPDLTVMKRTSNCGWAKTPMPTPITIVLKTIHQTLYVGLPQPNSGVDVHPRCPID